MESCSKHTYIKPSFKSALKGAPEVIKDEDWEVHSDELSDEFDSDEEQKEESKDQVLGKIVTDNEFVCFYVILTVEFRP